MKSKFKPKPKHSGKSKYLKETYTNDKDNKHRRSTWSYDMESDRSKII